MTSRSTLLILAKDVVPRFEKIRDAITQYDDKQVLLLSVGEYLRICIKRELNKERAQFPSFWEAMQQEASRTRIIMPVFACRDSFDRIVGKVDERQEAFMWKLDQGNNQTPKQYSISVYSPQFAEAISADADDFESWLRYWDVILGRDVPCTIITNQYKYTEASFGAIKLNPIDSPFAYVCDSIKDSDKLNKSWESDDFWAKLIPSLEKDMLFSELVLKELSITTFDFVSVIARWDTLNSVQRELVWMWYRVYHNDGYYSYVCNKAQKSAEIKERIRDEILYISSRNQDKIDERMKAMQVLGFTSYDDFYFAALDKLTVPEMRLQLLTYKTHEEKSYAVKTVSGMLRNGVESDAIANEILKDLYPSLSVYLKGQTGIDQEVDDYLSWYRKNKLINRFPGNYFKNILLIGLMQGLSS